MPSLTLSPTLTSNASTVPPPGAGTSIVALSDSSVINGSSALTASPSFTWISMIGTSLKSPMSGTLTSVAATCVSLFFCARAACGPALPIGYADWTRQDLAGFGFSGSMPNLLDRLRDDGGLHLALVGQRLQRRERDVVPVDLEERAQLAAIVGAAETVRPEHDDSAPGTNGRIWSAKAFM